MTKEKTHTLNQRIAEVEKKTLLTGSYSAKFAVGDKIVSNKVKSIKSKSCIILEVLEVYTPVRGMPSYRVWSERKGVRSSELCHIVDLTHRAVGELEEAVFL